MSDHPPRPPPPPRPPSGPTSSATSSPRTSPRAGSTAPVTRFPPEPNGYLHIGHAKSICLNFGIAAEFGGHCNLRFDDTNPVKEEQEYIDSIMADVRWLGFDWGENLFHASDYFEQLYAWAIHLIRAGDAFVDDLTADEIRETRGTLTEPGTNSPYRDRSIEENLDLFARMRAGEFPNGARVLRAKIDMAAPNINLRDPVLYRIVHADHPRTGDAWCIYPTYDYAHGQSDAIEGVTHSICTLEFDVHRPLYDWLIEHLPVPHVPHQYEFARLSLTYTVLSKRFLLKLVHRRPRPRLGRPPHAHHLRPAPARLPGRGHPRLRAPRSASPRPTAPTRWRSWSTASATSSTGPRPRRFGVLDPLKVVITNFPEDAVETMEVVNNPEDPSAGERPVPFSRELWIERDDFMEEPAPKFFRLAPGRRGPAAERLLRHLQRGRQGRRRCRHRAPVHLRPGHPRRLRARRSQGRRPRSTGSRRRHAVPAEIRLYDYLFARPDPGTDGRDLLDDLNPRLRDGASGATWSRRWPRPCPWRDGPVRAPGLLLRGPGLNAGGAGVQPDADAEGHVGEGAGSGVGSLPRVRAVRALIQRRQRGGPGSVQRQSGRATQPPPSERQRAYLLVDFNGLSRHPPSFQVGIRRPGLRRRQINRHPHRQGQRFTTYHAFPVCSDGKTAVRPDSEFEE